MAPFKRLTRALLALLLLQTMPIQAAQTTLDPQNLPDLIFKMARIINNLAPLSTTRPDILDEANGILEAAMLQVEGAQVADLNARVTSFETWFNGDNEAQMLDGPVPAANNQFIEKQSGNGMGMEEETEIIEERPETQPLLLNAELTPEYISRMLREASRNIPSIDQLERETAGEDDHTYAEENDETVNTNRELPDITEEQLNTLDEQFADGRGYERWLKWAAADPRLAAKLYKHYNIQVDKLQELQQSGNVMTIAEEQAALQRALAQAQEEQDPQTRAEVMVRLLEDRDRSGTMSEEQTGTSNPIFGSESGGSTFSSPIKAKPFGRVPTGESTLFGSPQFGMQNMNMDASQLPPVIQLNTAASMGSLQEGQQRGQGFPELVRNLQGSYPARVDSRSGSDKSQSFTSGEQVNLRDVQNPRNQGLGADVTENLQELSRQGAPKYFPSPIKVPAYEEVVKKDGGGTQTPSNSDAVSQSENMSLRGLADINRMRLEEMTEQAERSPEDIEEITEEVEEEADPSA